MTSLQLNDRPSPRQVPPELLLVWWTKPFGFPLHCSSFSAGKDCPSANISNLGVASVALLTTMGRQERIARSVVRAIVKPSVNGAQKRSSNPLAFILALFSAFFSLYRLVLRKVRPADFSNLRRTHWKLTDNDYTDSFQSDDGSMTEGGLEAIGDMGFSGSVRLYINFFFCPAGLTDTHPTSDLLLNPRPKIPYQIRPPPLGTLLLPRRPFNSLRPIHGHPPPFPPR